MIASGQCQYHPFDSASSVSLGQLHLFKGICKHLAKLTEELQTNFFICFMAMPFSRLHIFEHIFFDTIAVIRLMHIDISKGGLHSKRGLSKQVQ
jgi:hypothetical protein